MKTQINLKKIRTSRVVTRGFTLIELLVVIAIISILATILLPSLQQAKELANDVGCKNQLRNLGMVLQLYRQDYDDRMYHDNDGWVRPFIDGGYIEDPAESKCPSQQEGADNDCWGTGMQWVKPDGVFETRWNADIIGYGVNNFAFYGGGGSLNYQSFLYPDKTLIWFDSDIYGIRLLTFVAYPDSVAQHILRRHLDQANSVYLDGHVEDLTYEEIVCFKPTIGLRGY